MKYTNKFNFPQPIVTALTKDNYTKGDADISITGLLGPPRIRVLKKLNEDSLVRDVSDNVFSLLGRLMHGLLEQANQTALAEERFYLDIEGITVSGAMDAVYQDGLVQDYKLVSYHEVKRGLKPEFEAQLNCYAYLLKHGYTQSGEQFKRVINKLQDVFVFRDWSKGLAKRDPEVPQQQIITVDVPLWDESKTLKLIKDRIAIHKAANKLLPDCTPEERWAVPDKWAVMPKKNAVRSLKNHDNKKDAEEHSINVKGSFVALRPGKNNRCDDYCDVNAFCSQYKSLKEKK